MPTLGGGSPLPLGLGGGNSPQLQAYEAMRAAVGPQNAAAWGTIEAYWRFARACGVAAAVDDARAVMQIWPDRTTDFLPVYEAILGLGANASLSDEDRRQAIIARWVLTVTGVTATLEDSLQEIDPLFSLAEQPVAYAGTTVPGRAFEDYDPNDALACGPAFGGGRSSSRWPNYSGSYICRVLYAVGVGTLTALQKRRMAQAAEVLDRVLPAWCSWVIISDTSSGFILDQDLLDIGAF